MSAIELIALFVLVSISWYWLDGMRVKEIASSACARTCKSKDVHFLDESVAQTKVRICRNPHGRVVLYREYRFEFSSDGAYRYKGRVDLLGKQVVSLEMEPYRQDYSAENLLS